MMGFGEEGKKFPQNFFPSSPITNPPLLGTEPMKKTEVLLQSVLRDGFDPPAGELFNKLPAADTFSYRSGFPVKSVFAIMKKIRLWITQQNFRKNIQQE